MVDNVWILFCFSDSCRMFLSLGCGLVVVFCDCATAPRSSTVCSTRMYYYVGVTIRGSSTVVVLVCTAISNSRGRR